MPRPLLLAALLSGCMPPTELGALPPLPPPTVDVSHERELRGLWVATVANIDFPSRPGMPAEAQRAELLDLVGLAGDLGFNALFFQVRSCADAMYASDLEPWSRVLTGEEGGDPGYDPLATVIDAAHARGIEVHAWLNPFRASTTRKAHHPSHVSQTNPEWTVRYGDLLWLDPGRAETTERLERVVADLVRRYDLDGIHFDDYFYPYPVTGQRFDDDASFAASGHLVRDDWRRANVDAMVASIAEVVRRERPEVRFGVSPFGIYRPGIPEGIRGMDQVTAIYADPLAWTGSVDYLAPQLYWPTTKEAQAFGRLAGWWSDRGFPSTDVFAGLYLSALGTRPEWTLDELREQVRISREAPGLGGQIWFSARPLLEDRQGVRALVAELYAGPALPPSARRDPPGDPGLPTAPVASVRDGWLEVRGGARGYTLYRAADAPGLDGGGRSGWELSKVLGSNPEPVSLGEGRWALAAIDALGRESPALLLGP